MSHLSHNTRRGFTIIELLVVISIILIAVVAILPAFGRLIESNNYASAVNAVTATLGAARTKAVNNNRRAGVVFLWDAKEERMTLQIVEQAGEDSGSLTNQVAHQCVQTGAYAEIYHPATLSAPIELPKGMGVFGLSSAMETTTNPACDEMWLTEFPPDYPTWLWYAGDVINGANTDSNDDLYTWIFPRNDPRVFTEKDTAGNIGVDPWLALRGVTTTPAMTQDEAKMAVRNTTSFFVVFAPDGSITTSKPEGKNFFDAFLEYPEEPVDTGMPLDATGKANTYDDPYRFDPENFDAPNAPTPDRRSPNPEVVLRSADQLAIVDLNKLSDGVGMPRAWLIRPTQSKAPQPIYLMSARYFEDANARAVSRWIDINGEIISFNRYSGNVIRRTSQ